MTKILELVRRIVGREPALIVSAVGALLTFLVTFGLPFLTADDATNVLAVVSAIGTAVVGWATVNTRLSIVVGIARTVLILAVGYGLRLTQEQVGLAVLVISSFATIWLRDRNTPADTAISVGNTGYQTTGEAAPGGTLTRTLEHRLS
jgi:hypothetical protein